MQSNPRRFAAHVPVVYNPPMSGLDSAATTLATPPATGALLPDAISRLLARPDLLIAPHHRSLTFVPDLAQAFVVDPLGQIRLGPDCLARNEVAATRLRHGLELALLLRAGVSPSLAGLAAARVAAVFARIHGVGADMPLDVLLAPFASATPPGHAALRAAWPALRLLQQGAPATPDAAELDRLARLWPLLGPAEALLQSGGDQRLRIDPATGLNGYGCSHRPRPWAVTFASSTASSSSERGFAAAEAARARVTLAALTADPTPALLAEARAIRAEIAAHAGLAPPGQVVLAASGTDCELLALTLGVADPAAPVTNILVAPEETGSGVPLAATGRHFAADTARGTPVTKGARIDGQPEAVTLVPIAAREASGAMRPLSAIDADCARAVVRAVAAGHQVILHVLDISKTGYLAPSIETVGQLANRYPGQLTVVVDACQLRLTAARLAAYLARDWLVLITGSKFLTGPPFAGAVLVPPGLAPRLNHALPAGLAEYSFRGEWPEVARAQTLPEGANYGLLLRWHAALAEWQALAAVPEARTAEILGRFRAHVREAIEANPDIALVETPPPARASHAWDAEQTIIGFCLRPEDPLSPEDARRVYVWLNADLRPALPPTLSAEQERLACLRCHIGQPVALPARGGMMGVLRISAGARLVSGEPSHHDLDEDARLLREIRDAISVLAKISLILANWEALSRADPKPSF